MCYNILLNFFLKIDKPSSFPFLSNPLLISLFNFSYQIIRRTFSLFTIKIAIQIPIKARKAFYYSNYREIDLICVEIRTSAIHCSRKQWSKLFGRVQQFTVGNCKAIYFNHLWNSKRQIHLKMRFFHDLSEVALSIFLRIFHRLSINHNNHHVSSLRVGDLTFEYLEIRFIHDIFFIVCHWSWNI